MTLSDAHSISLAISPCPNDTFAFHGILSGHVTEPGIRFEVSFHDIQELNNCLITRRYDISKVSIPAALKAHNEYEVLPVGAAVGFGVGPVLVGLSGESRPLSEASVLCPGRDTTAALLMQRLHPEVRNIQHALFSEIVPRIREGAADYGVLIHEGRFTYSEQGLVLVEDLGATWEQKTSGPLPLGCLVAQKRIDPQLREQFCRLVRRSIQYGFDNRAETLLTMRQYAQEFDDEVLWKHVDLYVNHLTFNLGDVGYNAIAALNGIPRE